MPSPVAALDCCPRCPPVPSAPSLTLCWTILWCPSRLGGICCCSPTQWGDVDNDDIGGADGDDVDNDDIGGADGDDGDDDIGGVDGDDDDIGGVDGDGVDSDDIGGADGDDGDDDDIGGVDGDDVDNDDIEDVDGGDADNNDIEDADGGDVGDGGDVDNDAIEGVDGGDFDNDDIDNFESVDGGDVDNDILMLLKVPMVVILILILMKMLMIEWQNVWNVYCPQFKNYICICGSCNFNKPLLLHGVQCVAMCMLQSHTVYMQKPTLSSYMQTHALVLLLSLLEKRQLWKVWLKAKWLKYDQPWKASQNGNRYVPLLQQSSTTYLSIAL